MARILVVDDAIYFRLFVTRVLQESGHVTAEAENGREAVAKYDSFRPDLVIMDVTMPMMDGMTATREIRLRDPGARVVLVSGFVQDATIEDALRAGARRFLAKPLAAPVLLEVVETLLRE